MSMASQFESIKLEEKNSKQESSNIKNKNM